MMLPMLLSKKRRLLVACLTLAIATPAVAEEPNFHGMRISAWAVEFGISNATLTSFDGATISLRHQRDEHAAWRYSLSVSATSQDSQQDRITLGSPVTTSDESEYGGFSTSIGLARLSFPAPEAIVRPWYGLGIELGWTANHSKRDSRYRDGSGVVVSTQGSEDNQNGPTAAMIGMFGLEWSPSQRFAIHAQYGQGVSYRHLRTEWTDYYQSSSTDEHNSRDGSSDNWSTYPASARAGVSVFF